MNKTLSTSLTILYLLSTVFLTGLALNIQQIKAEPMPIIVPDDYLTIQEAINSANEGNTIFVRNGTYCERVVVNKTVSLIGENKDTTIIDGNRTGTVVTVTANNVLMTEFTMRNGNGGLYLDSSCNTTIMSNKMLKNKEYGIKLVKSSRNNIAENIVTDNEEYGVFLYYSSDHNNVSSNVIANNSKYGLHLLRVSRNILKNNNLTSNRYNFGIYGFKDDPYTGRNELDHDIDFSNTVNGKSIYYLTNQNDLTIDASTLPSVGYIALVNSTRITIKDLTLTNNFHGIFVADSSYCTIQNITLAKNEHGIHILGKGKHYPPTEHIIQGNNITNNEAGIYIDVTKGNVIRYNNIADNVVGIMFTCSYLNRFYHNNFINNTDQVLYIVGCPPAWLWDVWDNGYPSGGNYWSDYADMDFKNGANQDQPGSDGIGDVQYTVQCSGIGDVNYTDDFPLMAPISVFHAGAWNGVSYRVDVISNSSVWNFYFNPGQGAFLRFKVTGEDGTTGFCRVTIPKDLLWAEDGWAVYVGEQPIIDYAIIPDENYTYIYFTYQHSTKTVQIEGTHVIPEFPSFLTMPLFMIATLLAIIVYKRIHQTRNKKREI